MFLSIDVVPGDIPLLVDLSIKKRMTAIFLLMDGTVNLQEVDGVLDNTVADIAIVPTSLSLKVF